MNLDSIDVLQIITKILIIFLVLPIHECAHAWAAHKMGDETAAYSGRLTLNPLAHIDILGALCLLITGFGWAKPVPINPLKFKKQRFGIAITAAAGPLSTAVRFLSNDNLQNCPFASRRLGLFFIKRRRYNGRLCYTLYTSVFYPGKYRSCHL